MYDYLIIGGGIIGLNIARELKQRDENSEILLIEKDTNLLDLLKKQYSENIIFINKDVLKINENEIDKRIKNKIAPKLMKSESKTSKTIFIPTGIFMEFNHIRFEKEVIGTISKVSINVANRYKEKFLNKIFTVQNFSVRKSHSIINPHYAQKFYFFNFSFI